jgi:hypothetical protein
MVSKFRETFGDEAVEEVQGYANGFGKLMADIGKGGVSVAQAAKTDFQNAYWNQFMGGGRPSPPTPLSGEMEITTSPKEPPPQSYDAALRQHYAMEQADIRARHEADPDRERARQQWLPDPRAEATGQVQVGPSSQPTQGNDVARTAEPWMRATGGADALDEGQLASARRSYAAWAEAKPDYADRHDFADYVHYVQDKAAERDSLIQAPEIKAPIIEGPIISAPEQADPSPGSHPTETHSAVEPEP